MNLAIVRPLQQATYHKGNPHNEQHTYTDGGAIMTFGSHHKIKRYTYRTFVTVYAESEEQADELAMTFEYERPDALGSCTLEDGPPDVEEVES